MTEEPPKSGWTFFRLVGFAISLVGMLGFGICSACGLIMGAGGTADAQTILMFVIPGLALTAFFIWMARKILRKTSAPPK